MRDALYSPGQATAERAGLEAALTSALLRELRMFLVGVRRDAARAVESPLLLAAAVEPFALASVLGRWAQFSAAVLAQVSRKLPYADDALTRSEYLRGVERRLRDSSLPLSTYEAARAVLVQHAGDPTSTRYAVNRALAKALEAGRGSEWHNQAERIARTEATALHAHNQQAAMNEAGVEFKRWVAVRDGKTRPAHARANGQTVPVDSAFVVGGWSMQGPGDPSAPAEQTANCRCVQVAVSQPSATPVAAAGTG